MARSSSFFSRTFIFLNALFRAVEYASVAALLFIVEAVPAGATYAWRMVLAVGITVFRVIGQLKPVYRESYDTHGLNLYRLHPS